MDQSLPDSIQIRRISNVEISAVFHKNKKIVFTSPEELKGKTVNSMYDADHVIDNDLDFPLARWEVTSPKGWDIWQYERRVASYVQSLKHAENQEPIKPEELIIDIEKKKDTILDPRECDIWTSQHIADWICQYNKPELELREIKYFRRYNHGLCFEFLCVWNHTDANGIFKQSWQKYVDLSQKYATTAIALPQEKNILIAYVSAYENTTLMAEKIAEGLRQSCDFKIDICDIESVHASKLEEKIAHCSGIIVGSPTINQNILPQIYQIFATINPIRDKGKLAAAFGSYGWSGEAVRMIESNFTMLKLKVFDQNVMVKFKPHEPEFEKCIAFGKAYAEKMIEIYQLSCTL